MLLVRRVADGTIYLYFKSKDDLLISLFEEKMEQIVATFRAEVNRHEDARERLKCFLELHLKMVAERPALTEVMTVELRQSAKFMREYKAPQFSAYLGLSERNHFIWSEPSRNPIKSRPTPYSSNHFWGARRTQSVLGGTKRPQHSLERVVDELWSLCSAGCLKSRAEKHHV